MTIAYFWSLVALYFARRHSNVISTLCIFCVALLATSLSVCGTSYFAVAQEQHDGDYVPKDGETCFKTEHYICRCREGETPSSTGCGSCSDTGRTKIISNCFKFGPAVQNSFEGRTGPDLNVVTSRDVLQEAKRIKDMQGEWTSRSAAYSGGGKVEFSGEPANDHELQMAVELAMTAHKYVIVLGKLSSSGDFEIDFVRFEVKGLTQNRQSTVLNAIQEAIEQADNAIIDGRVSGVAKGTAVAALTEWMEGQRYDKDKTITIYTREGRVRYIPKRGLAKD